MGWLHRTLGQTALWVFGWKTEGHPPPFAKAVFVAAPHTSGWDLYFMLAVAWSLGLKPSWFGKHTLFRFPMGPLTRFAGGIPIDRRTRGSYVERSVASFEQHERLYMVVSPPGTRKKTLFWKSGFYHIADQAGVPICCAFLDYRRKVGGIGPTVVPTGDPRADMKPLRAFYSNVTPRHPEKKSDIRLELEDEPPVSRT